MKMTHVHANKLDILMNKLFQFIHDSCFPKGNNIALALSVLPQNVTSVEYIVLQWQNIFGLSIAFLSMQKKNE